MSTITKLSISAITAVALLLPYAPAGAVHGGTALFGVPDEAQKAIILKEQEAKKELAGAQAATGTERQTTMESHMKLMDDILAQMQKAKPGANMTPEQMRDWIDEHMKLMDELMGQMMEEHHMMMQSMGMMKK